MFTALDHIIIGVRNLDSAAQTFQQQLGLVPSGGGTHPTGGTANRIIVIGDTYLELITVYKPEEAQESLRTRLEQREGYCNFVLASDDLEADCQAMKARGIVVVGPGAGMLRSGDGRARGWMRADIERPDMVQRNPFLIQHDSVGEERRARLAGWTTPPEHPLGAFKVHSVTLAVPDLNAASQRFSRIYGLQPSEPFSARARGWAAQIVTFSLASGGQSITMAVPEQETRENDQDYGLKHHLAQAGESLFSLTLLVKDLESAGAYLAERGVTYSLSGKAPQTLLWIDPEQSNGAQLILRQA